MATSALLKRSEQTTCKRIAASGTGLESKRAAALLSLNTGATQTDTAAQAGLTLGQVRYLLTIFRNRGMTIFATPPKSAAKTSAAKAKAPAKAAATKKPKADKGGKKKAKKEKDKKPKKKDKSDKKKGKKSKKKKK